MSAPVGWDTLEVPTERHEKFPAYQSGREFDDELLDQLDLLPEFVAACGFQNAKAPGYEADDFLAAAVAAEKRRHGTALVASGDRDTFQLASDITTILYPVRAGEMARIGPAEVRDRYGVDPGQVPDFIALRGDPSDKLPGARGVGPKGAADLLKRYGTLDNILAAGLFPSQANDLRLFRSIATMNRKAPLPSLASQNPTWTKAADLARTWGLNQLADRMSKLQIEGRPSWFERGLDLPKSGRPLTSARASPHPSGATVPFAKPYIDAIPSVVVTGESGEALQVTATKTGFTLTSDAGTQAVSWQACYFTIGSAGCTFPFAARDCPMHWVRGCSAAWDHSCQAGRATAHRSATLATNAIGASRWPHQLMTCARTLRLCARSI